MKSILLTLIVAMTIHTAIISWQLAETQRLVETANAQAEVALSMVKNSKKIYLTKMGE